MKAPETTPHFDQFASVFSQHYEANYVDTDYVGLLRKRSQDMRLTPSIATFSGFCLRESRSSFCRTGCQ